MPRRDSNLCPERVLAVPTTYRGGCHCGAVRYRVDLDLSKPVTQCNCSICSRTGTLLSFAPASSFTLEKGEDSLTDYQFKRKHIHHVFCKVCGVHPFYSPRSDPDKVDVNVRCLDDIDLAAIAPKRFDGRNWEAAMQQHVPWR